MTTTITIQSLAELVQVANRSGKTVDLQRPLHFPMEIFTEVPEGSPEKMTFEEFESKFLKQQL